MQTAYKKKEPIVIPFQNFLKVNCRKKTLELFM